MLQTLLTTSFALVPLTLFAAQGGGQGGRGGRDAPAQEELTRQDEAVALLESAAAAARDLRTASYTSTSQVSRRQGPPSAASGQVRFAMLETPDSVGAKLAVDGRAPEAGADGKDVVFKLAYDGSFARARFGEETVLWETTMAEYGEELLSIGEQLVMPELHARGPYAVALRAPGVTVDEGDVQVGDETCRRVIVQHGNEGRHAKVEWFLSVEDHLPRRRVAELHRRGVFQVEAIELSNLIKNPKIHDAVFTLPSPGNYEVKAYQSDRPKSPKLIRAGEPAPPFALRDASGAMHSLSDYRGKVLVLDFWATWCQPCHQAMPGVQRLHERFADNERVQVIGISTAERGGDPAEYMKLAGYTYGLLLNGEAIQQDYQAVYLPTFYVIGKDGKVLYADFGLEPDLDKQLAVLIEEELR